MTMLVRIKPYNPKRGQLTRRYVIDSYRFDVERGWYEVDDELAEVLRTKTRDGDEASPLIFDVCTEAEAVAMQAAEDRAKHEAARADKPLRPERFADSSRRGKTTTADIAPSKTTKTVEDGAPLAADGADDEDDEDDDEGEDDGRVAAVGRLDAPAPSKGGTSRRRRAS